MTADADQPISGEDSDGSSPILPPAMGFWARLGWAFRGGPLPTPTQEQTPMSPAVGIARPSMRNLRDLAVEDVMVPKADIVAVPVTITKSDLVNTFQNSGLTRLPVYDATLDTPLGFLHMKDMALKHGFNAAKERFVLRKMLRPLLFVPPSMPIGVLLAKMQADRVHMALVIYEYGGTDGLVTIEDLIEQVIGEIEDEHDIDEAKHFAEEKPGIYVALAKTQVDVFEAEIGIDLTAAED
ncbi:MAG: CBS domain-containing protein, partial [Pseudomonadota bacterium]